MLRNRARRSFTVVGTLLVLCVLVATAARGWITRTKTHGRPTRVARVGASRHGFDKIQHVVFIIKENRTFDNYFGTFPGADGATTGTISTGAVIPLGPTGDRTPRDIDHSFKAATTAINGGAMDQFDLIQGETRTATIWPTPS